MNVSLVKRRTQQLLALMTHPQSFFSRYDYPWNHALYSDAIQTLSDPGRQILLKDLCNKIGLEENVSVQLEEAYEVKDGGVKASELLAICHLVSQLKPKNILEVGTFLGRTTLNMALNAPESQIYTLNWPQSRCTFEVGEKFKNRKDVSNIIQLWGDTKNFDFSKIPKIDFAFIDADHSYNYVINDSEKVLSCLSEDGFIVWHDCDLLHLGSVAGVRDFCKNNSLDFKCIDGTTLAICSKKLK